MLIIFQSWFSTHFFFFYLISPSIHFLHCFSVKGNLEFGIWTLGKRQRTPWAGVTQRQTTIHTYIHTYAQFRVPIWPNLRVFGRKQEHPEETCTDTRRACRLRTERLQSVSRFKPRTLLLWGDRANCCSTIPPVQHLNM